MKTSFMQNNSTESPFVPSIELVALINLAEYVVLNVALKIQMQVSTQVTRRVSTWTSTSSSGFPGGSLGRVTRQAGLRRLLKAS